MIDNTYMSEYKFWFLLFEGIFASVGFLLVLLFALKLDVVPNSPLASFVFLVGIGIAAVFVVANWKGW